MTKRITLLLSAAALCFSPLFAQVATQTDNGDGIDSLEGFMADVAMMHSGEAHDPAEAENQLALAKRNYIDRKFQLGKYDPNYYASNLKQNNPVFPVVACTNVDFETGDFTGWGGAIGDNDLNSFGPLQNIQTGIFATIQNEALANSNARHTIMSNAFGPDPYGGFPVVPTNGGSYSVRLGGITPNYQGEYIEQTFTVSPTSTSFAYQYACVLWSGGHPPADQPYFRIEVLDQNGNPISPCTQLYVTAGADALNQGFFQYASQPDIYYKPWTAVNFDLSAFVNTDVTVRFTVAGCTQSGHWGYAYIDCSCSSLAATVNFCPGNNFLYLNAPSGYGSYQWFDPNMTPIPGATNDTLLVTNPVVGDTFYVYLVSQVDTSCHNTLPVILQYTEIFANATSTNASCYGVPDGTAASAPSAGVLPYTYIWNTIPPQTTQTVTNLVAGQYIIHLIDSFGCEDFDTVIVTSPPRLDTSLVYYSFCPGDPDILLTAPAGFTNYLWIGPNGDTLGTGVSVVVTGPQINTQYNVILHSPPACPIYDSIILNLNPPSNFFNPDSTINVFTPNGDLKNDRFYPYYDNTIAQQVSTGAQPEYNFSMLYIDKYEIWIYDRWGKEVFYSSDYTQAWDGTVGQGKDCTDGVYFWVCKMTSRCKVDQTPIESKGFVHLIR
ncbi:MAG: gliding motility-associated C-terminal domain-containing protein [Bacteroidota bacterium]|nr:gliding motility-associated C-terminal domain-containing protein [Bacteroidota bacterium]